MDSLLLIAIGVFSRLIPHPANMTAAGAVGLIAGRNKPLAVALLISFATMLVSDVFIGFHSLMWATYGGMAVAVLIGKCIGKRNNISVVTSATLASSLVFFLITNFAVWNLPHSMYPHSLPGLIECYIVAIPFFRNSIMGDLVYTYSLVYIPLFIRARNKTFEYKYEI